MLCKVSNIWIKLENGHLWWSWQLWRWASLLHECMVLHEFLALNHAELNKADFACLSHKERPLLDDGQRLHQARWCQMQWAQIWLLPLFLHVYTHSSENGLVSLKLVLNIRIKWQLFVAAFAANMLRKGGINSHKLFVHFMLFSRYHYWRSKGWTQMMILYDDKCILVWRKL